MHKLYDIKDMLMEELESHADEQLNGAILNEIDTLAHALKNVCKIIDCCDDEYSYRGNSYGRKRDSMGRFSRDNMSRDMSRDNSRDGRYSGEDPIEQLERMMATSDDRYRGKIRELIREMRNG